MVTAIANHVDTLSLNRIIHMLVCRREGLQHKTKGKRPLAQSGGHYHYHYGRKMGFSGRSRQRSVE